MGRIIVSVIIFLGALICTLAYDGNVNYNKLESKTKSYDSLMVEYSEVDKLYQLQSQINLRIMNTLSDSDLKKLRNDSTYMYLTDKID